MAVCSKKKSLTFLTGICACIGFIILCISVATDFWLYTFERETHNNGTNLIAMHSGLWRKCWTSRFLPGVTKKSLWRQDMVARPTSNNCSYISYLTGKPEGTGDLKPTESIIYDMRPSAFFPLSGLLFLMIGCILSFINYCDRKIKVLIFVGGGLYVFSGICMLIGIVLYVGSISQAFDSKSGGLETESRFVYNYGGSFYFSVVAFVLSEFAGIFAVYLYIAKHRHHLRIKRERLLGTNGGLSEISTVPGDGTLLRNSEGSGGSGRRRARNTSGCSSESPRLTGGGGFETTLDDIGGREEFTPVLGPGGHTALAYHHILSPHQHHPACGLDADHHHQHQQHHHGNNRLVNTIGGQLSATNSSYHIFYPAGGGNQNQTLNTPVGVGFMSSSNDSANDPYGFDYEYQEPRTSPPAPSSQPPPPTYQTAVKRHPQHHQHHRHTLQHQHNSFESGMPVSHSAEFGSQCNCTAYPTSTNTTVGGPGASSASLPKLNPEMDGEGENHGSSALHSFAGNGGSGGLQRSQKITSV